MTKRDELPNHKKMQMNLKCTVLSGRKDSEETTYIF